MKPIIFSTPMVQAILAGRKTQTRRVLKPQPVIDAHGMWLWKDFQWMDGGLGFPASGIEDYAPYKPGDILWVRETWSPVQVLPKRYLYKADAENGGEGDGLPIRWRPSIHMPREAARLFLRVTGVRVERVQDITHAGALAEGIVQCPGWKFELSECDCTIVEFGKLWDALGFEWERNPWVFVCSFERITKEEVNDE